MELYEPYKKCFDIIGKNKNNIVLINNFINIEDLDKINNFLNKFKNNDNFIGGKDLRKENIEDNEIKTILNFYEEKIYQTAKSLFTEKYGISLIRRPVNPTHFVKWVPGMNSKLHADCEKPDGTPAMAADFYKYNVSVLMYPNQDYAGGQITFPDYGIVIKPKPGDFIMFPGNNDYRHTVEKVTDGVRYTMPSWYSFNVKEPIQKTTNKNWTYQDSVQLWDGMPDFDKIDPIGTKTREEYEKSKMER